MNENEGLISEDMLDRLIELAVAKPSAPMKLIHAKPVLGEDEYLVHVDYTIPSFAELKKEFGEGNVSNLFGGSLLQKHASCVGMDETPGDRIFFLKHFRRVTDSEGNITEMETLGFRPATHLEAYAFQKVNPERQRQFWIVALGSFEELGGKHRVAVLSGGSIRRILDHYWFGHWWRADDRFLFVRK